jgi:HlyD family secretion protein
MITILKQHWKLPLIALIALMFAIVSVFTQPKAAKHEPLVLPPRTSYHQALAGIGVIEPQSEVIAIGAELPGIVRSVQVKVGDAVAKNAPLFSLDSRDADATIAVLQALLATAEVQLADASAQFEIVNGIEDRRAVAKDDFNRRKYGKQIAAARVEEIRAQLDEAIVTQDRLTIRAPIEGTILEVNVRPGEYATTGNLGTPLMIMGDTSVLHVRVEIDEENAFRVLPGSQAEGMLRGQPDRVFPLTFVRFEPYVRPKQNLATLGQRVDTRVMRVIYALPDTKERLLVGQQMDVYIKESSTKE